MGVWLLCVLVSLCGCQVVRELSLSTTWQAEDAGFLPAQHYQCHAWQLWWRAQNEHVDFSYADIDLLAIRRPQISIHNQADAVRYRIPADLLRMYTVIHVDFEELCRMHPRILWINDTNTAAKHHLQREGLCESASQSQTQVDLLFEEAVKKKERGQRDLTISHASTDTSPREQDVHADDVVLLLEDGERNATEEQVEVDGGNEIGNATIVEEDPIVWVNDTETNDRLKLGMSPKLFHVHKAVGILKKEVCEGEVTLSVDLSSYEEKYGKFEYDVSSLGMDIDQLVANANNDSSLDNILRVFEARQVSEERPFPSTQILPFLKKRRYDSRTPPVLFRGQTATVKVGIHIQSMSNFELTTMDYDMDVWLRMAWKDPRLAHGLSKPILINEYTFLKKIWRPDPFFRNAKQALFHKVTYLNFYMYIFPNGELFLEMRVYLKPSAQIILCKYPHDMPKCALRISSLGFTSDVVRFSWFSRREDAIRINRKLQLPELVLVDYTHAECDGSRKSGNYSCLEALFTLRRDTGYHIAQTYIPTTICVVFSWISVWLPEEFVEGRIFVSLTVFLTLSAENNAAKEDLPKVSYIKAIDIWFGFTSTFVFLTMLQALIVISLENNSAKMRKRAETDDELSTYAAVKMLMRSRRYHKYARNCDTFCKMTLWVFGVNAMLSLLGAVVSRKLILEYIPIFVQRKMYGNDQCKVSNAPVPEPMGMIVAAVYLIVMFLFIPFPFFEWTTTESPFPHAKLLAFLSALISICTAILLGFADDMLDLRWRHKLLFPTLSSLPVLMVYYVSGSSTTVAIPPVVRQLLPSLGLPGSVDIMFVYYVFMGMVVVFCTNAINILAGINGLEVGQSIVIAASACVFNIIQLVRDVESQMWYHSLSLAFLVPFLACASVLYSFNRYPARVFVGDTFCYWSGMTLAVVSILGHFSKTMILFLVPQIFNFVYSIPQLFKLVPCPRHRLPKFDPQTDTVGISRAEFKKSELKPLGALVLRVFQVVGLLDRKEFEKDGETYISINNLTILNLVLIYTGPVHEATLTNILLGIQVAFSCVAFFIRFYLAYVFYDVVN